MYIALVFQVAGMVGGLADVFALAGLPLGKTVLTLAVAGSCALLLVVGRYALVEHLSTALVALFVIATLFAVGALQGTDYAITAQQLGQGLSFQLPDKFTTAFAAFGIVGVGASELIYYPYWCLEKGYGRSIGTNDGTAAWNERARGWMRIMRIDAWVSFAIYTTTTLAFYLLGAAILHAKNLQVEDSQMIATLSHMYRETFGPSSFWLFLVGAFAVLYSTVFGATASNARLFADALSLFGLVRYNSPADRTRWVKIGCVLLPAAFATVFLTLGNPVSLVFVGALAQGIMLPFLGAAALYLLYRRTQAALRPGLIWTILLWASVISMAVAGSYKVFEEVSTLLK
jgi:Mn2+/Fe2+ NRAMP family transporter